MKIISQFAFYTILLAQLHLTSAEVDPWTINWANGIELSSTPENYRIALQEYNNAINKIEPNQISNHLYLFNERGNLYYKLGNFDQAIKDFSFVLNQKGVSREEACDALWGRMQTFSALENSKNFAQDCQYLKQMEIYITPREETAKFFIFKMGPRMQKDERIQDTFVKTLIRRGSIRTERDVIFSPLTGMGMVRKSKADESLTNLFNK